MAHLNGADRTVEQRIEDRQHVGPRDTRDDLDAIRLERTDDGLTARRSPQALPCRLQAGREWVRAHANGIGTMSRGAAENARTGLALTVGSVKIRGSDSVVQPQTVRSV